MRRASSGTAMSASPNPNTDRISVAANTTIKTYTVVPSNGFSGDSGQFQS